MVKTISPVIRKPNIVFEKSGISGNIYEYDEIEWTFVFYGKLIISTKKGTFFYNQQDYYSVFPKTSDEKYREELFDLKIKLGMPDLIRELKAIRKGGAQNV